LLYINCVNHLHIRPGYLTDNRGTVKSSVRCNSGLSVPQFNIIKDGLVAANT